MSKESLAQIYDALAHRYADGDGINDFYTLPLVKHFCLPSVNNALEVCCGAGRIAIELAKNIQSVWGIDLSFETQKVARFSGLEKSRTLETRASRQKFPTDLGGTILERTSRCKH